MRHRLPSVSRLTLAALLPLLIALSTGRAPEAHAQSATEQLATARRLEHNGEYEAAEPFYQGAIQDGGETGLIARLELARLYERWERYTAALDTLRPLTDATTPDPRTGGSETRPHHPSRPWFQLGSVLQSLGRAEEAIAAYQRAVELNSPASAYARVETAKLQTGREEPAAALVTLAPLLGGEGPENARRAALRIAAPAAEGLGADWSARALAYYRGHAALATTAAERVPSLWKAAELSRERGDRTTAGEIYAELVTSYPGFKEAEDALEALVLLGRPAGTLEAALVHYRRRNNDTARRLYNQVLAGSPTATQRATALFYLGALAERRDDAALAVENYTESFQAEPGGRLADDALWYRALIHEERGDLPAAQADYALIAERGAAAGVAAEAAFRNGYIAYEAGQREEARRRWSAHAGARRNDIAATASFWAGRAAAEAGDSAAAQAAYTEAVRRDPTGYYGLRAAAALAGSTGAPVNGSATLRLPAEDWAAAEAWLAGWAGPEDTVAWTALQNGEDWRATWELVEAGWDKAALEAHLRLLGRHAHKPWLQYRAARVLSDGGFPRAAFSAGFNIVARAPADSTVPTAIQRLRYPAPWSDVVQRYADRRGIDPLLFYAMMRQESAFDPRAGSSAGAFGLTQFIEGTARDVGRALGKDVRFTDLARPSLAIEFGAFYLAAQIRDAGGSVYQGLAAYNGGPGSAARWRRAASSAADVDRFVEAIDFRETELYIRLVLENYAWYRFLYGAAERPSLVR